MSVTLPHCALARSAVYDCSIPDHTHFCVSVSCYHKLVCHSDISGSDQLSLSMVVGSNSVGDQETRFNLISNLDYL